MTNTIRRIKDASEAAFTYLYVSHVDHLGHLYGVTRPKVKHALNEVDNEMARLTSGGGGKTRVVVIADP